MFKVEQNKRERGEFYFLLYPFQNIYGHHSYCWIFLISLLCLYSIRCEGPQHSCPAPGLVYTHRRVSLATLPASLSVLLLPADCLLHGGQEAGHPGGHGGLFAGVVVDDLSVLSILNDNFVSLILGRLLSLGRLSLTTNIKIIHKLAPMEIRFDKNSPLFLFNGLLFVFFWLRRILKWMKH